MTIFRIIGLIYFLIFVGYLFVIDIISLKNAKKLHKEIEKEIFEALQEDIDNLQQAYNQLQKDLEVLREYES